MRSTTTRIVTAGAHCTKREKERRVDHRHHQSSSFHSLTLVFVLYVCATVNIHQILLRKMFVCVLDRIALCALAMPSNRNHHQRHSRRVVRSHYFYFSTTVWNDEPHNAFALSHSLVLGFVTKHKARSLFVDSLLFTARG